MNFNQHFINNAKQLIIGENLFWEIGESKKLVKNSCRQIKSSQSLDISLLDIAKFILR